MVEEIKKSGLTFKEAKNLVDVSIRDVKDGFVATGYYLWIIREERLWEDDGYNSFQEFLHCQYKKDKSWASRCIGLYEKFGESIEFGELPALALPYRGYSVSQLIEMVSMTEEQREQVTPEMKVREIREMKPKKKAAKAPERGGLAEDSGTKPEGQIPEQSEIPENAETVATVATIVKADGAKKGDTAGECADQEEFYGSLTEAPGEEKDEEPSQLELPVLKNEDQRKEWLKNYKAWGLWYRDEHIDVNYYKFDFEDGSRLVVSEFPQRENERSVKKYDQVYYHLIEHEKRKYQSDKVYEDKYQYHSNSVTELVEYLKKIWQKKKG